MSGRITAAAAGWAGIFGGTILCLDRIRYTHYLAVRNNMERDCADPYTIDMYDGWLNSSWYHRLRYEPLNGN